MKQTILRTLLGTALALGVWGAASGEVSVGREGDKVVALLTGEDAANLWKKLSQAPAASPGGFGQVNYLKSFETGGEAPKLAIFCYDFHGRGSELFCRVALDGLRRSGRSIETRLEGRQARALRGALAGFASFATRNREVELSCEAGGEEGPCVVRVESAP